MSGSCFWVLSNFKIKRLWLCWRVLSELRLSLKSGSCFWVLSDFKICWISAAIVDGIFDGGFIVDGLVMAALSRSLVVFLALQSKGVICPACGVYLGVSGKS